MKNSAKKISVVLYQLFIPHDYHNKSYYYSKKIQPFLKNLHFCNIILEHCMALPWPFQWLV